MVGTSRMDFDAVRKIHQSTYCLRRPRPDGRQTQHGYQVGLENETTGLIGNAQSFALGSIG